jgi:hypothetical protein
VAGIRAGRRAPPSGSPAGTKPENASPASAEHSPASAASAERVPGQRRTGAEAGGAREWASDGAGGAGAAVVLRAAPRSSSDPARVTNILVHWQGGEGYCRVQGIASANVAHEPTPFHSAATIPQFGSQ